MQLNLPKVFDVMLYEPQSVQQLELSLDIGGQLCAGHDGIPIITASKIAASGQTGMADLALSRVTLATQVSYASMPLPCTCGNRVLPNRL